MKNHRILNYKEAQNAENFCVDSFRHAGSIDNVCERVESTVLEVQAKKVPDQKIFELQAVINTVDHYDINMEELAHQ